MKNRSVLDEDLGQIYYYADLILVDMKTGREQPV